MTPDDLNVGLAFVAGLASFLSPCVFALVPAYISYLGGRSAASAQSSVTGKWFTVSHALVFVLGFSFVFVSLGLGVSALGQALYDLRPFLTRLGGHVVVIFGLHMTGIIRVPLLEYDLRPQKAPDRKWGYLSSFLMGVFFSAGWSPCVGPVLGAILTLSINSGSILQGGILLASYSAGLAIPFLLAATQINLVTTVIRRYGKVMRFVEAGMGLLLITVGVLLIGNKLARIASLGSSFFGAVDEGSVGLIMLVAILGTGLLGLIPAKIASQKGRNFYDWWIFGAGLFIVALPMALRLKPIKPFTREKEDLQEIQ